jgi:hypothetical protein
MAAEYYNIINETELNFNGFIRLHETSPNIPKRCAWGSFMSASAISIANCEEAVLIAFCRTWKRSGAGILSE